MNPTLTKASEALRESLADWQGNGDLPTFAVIAVLKAIREPSEEMIEAGIASVEECTDNWTASAACASAHAWMRMIDAITNHNPTANHGSGE